MGQKLNESNEQLVLAIDVHYKEKYAKAVGVIFDWEDQKPKEIVLENCSDVAPYQSGQFYKRELPCILALLNKINLGEISHIIVDGHVYIDNDKKLGLGGHLWKALDEKIPIIGIAKKSFHQTELVTLPFFRGKSNNPLFISSIGILTDIAFQKIKLLHGSYRIPSVLKILDQLTKEN